MVCTAGHSKPKCGKNELGFNPTALRNAKIVYNFGHSECNRLIADRPGSDINYVLHILGMG